MKTKISIAVLGSTGYVGLELVYLLSKKEDISINFLGSENSANKKTVKKNIEKIFKVNVVKINIINKQRRIKTSRGRKIRVQGYKKAIVTLKKGQNIDLTTGI